MKHGETNPGGLKEIKFKTRDKKMFEEKVGINCMIFEKYLLELKGPKTDNGKNNKTKDEAT